jgi:hypothetical protein
VDWGDGTVQRYDHEGAAYPEGTITHSYQRAGIFRVVVTAEWSVPWTIGPTTGTVQGITTQAAIDNFEVRQLQPVRNT